MAKAPHPALQALKYDPNPPRCFNCAKRFTAHGKSLKGKPVRDLMCSIAQQPVRASGICDSWVGYKGETLET